MSKVEPALTPEEWVRYVRFTEFGLCTRSATFADFTTGEELNTERPEVIAALALHGQPFGFTWADVDALDLAVSEMHVYSSLYGPEEQERARAAIAKLAVLLPPREGAE